MNEDLKEEIKRYSSSSSRMPTKFDNYACSCGNEEFKLYSDDNEGGCGIVCPKCEQGISIFESADYMEEVAQNTCLCGQEELLIMTGASFYPDSKDIEHVYVGAKCPKCKLVGVYVDSKER